MTAAWKNAVTAAQGACLQPAPCAAAQQKKGHSPGALCGGNWRISAMDPHCTLHGAARREPIKQPNFPRWIYRSF
jgi:hypothetical protein